MKNKESIIELLTKINSEGLHYYFTEYTGTHKTKEEYPGITDRFFKAAMAFENAADELEDAKVEMMKQYGITGQEIEY